MDKLLQLLCVGACAVGFAACGFPRPADVADCTSLDATSCPTDKPVCDMAGGVCRGCTSHSECESHVCTADGTCAEEASIAHADPAGSSAGDCSQLSPCTLTQALAVLPTRPYVLLGAGTYNNATTLAVGGKRFLVGDGSVRPVITNVAAGPIFSISVSSDVTFDNLQLFGAKNGSPSAPPYGYAVDCNDDISKGLRVVHLVGDLISQNASHGVLGQHCAVFATRSTFSDNGGSGVIITDGGGAFDRCTFSGNAQEGINLDGGLYSVTNSFIYRNMTGIEIYPSQPGNVVAFNTIVDNSTGFNCIGDGTSSGSFPDNIIARSTLDALVGTSCTFPSSIIMADAAALRFTHPDASPFDYHLTTGSLAIDHATSSMVDHDFDGDARPKGSGRDIGADEAE